MIEKQPAPRLYITDKPQRAGIPSVLADWEIGEQGGRTEKEWRIFKNEC